MPRMFVIYVLQFTTGKSAVQDTAPGIGILLFVTEINRTACGGVTAKNISAFCVLDLEI